MGRLIGEIYLTRWGKPVQSALLAVDLERDLPARRYNIILVVTKYVASLALTKSALLYHHR